MQLKTTFGTTNKSYAASAHHSILTASSANYPHAHFFPVKHRSVKQAQPRTVACDRHSAERWL